MNITSLKQSLVHIVVFAVLAGAIALPSGSVYGINVKLLSVCVLGVICVSYFLFAKYSLYYAVAFSLFTGLVFLYGLIGIAHDVPVANVVDQTVAIMSLFSITYLPLFLLHVSVVSYSFLFSSMLVAITIVCIVKMLFLYLLVSGVPLVALKTALEDVFGVSFIGLDIGGLYRINFPIDYILPPAMYAVISCSTFGYKIAHLPRLTFLLLVTMSVVLSYSRYLWVYGVVALLLAYIVNNRINFRKRIVFSVAAIAIGIISFASFSSFVLERYSGEHASSSDYTRVAMYKALIDTIEYHPIIGEGIGSSAIGFTNIEAVPWYFELQWLAFVMQFGVVGALLILVSLLAAFNYQLGTISSFAQFGWLLLYLLWLGVGVVNGFMLTSAGGAIFLFYFVAAGLLKHKRKENGIHAS